MPMTPKEKLYRIREKHVRIPALRAMAARPSGRISTSELIAALENQFKPAGEDAAILENRHDTKFSQIVRNLKSHRTASTNIFARGYAEDAGNGFKITPAGREFLAKLPE